MSNLFLTGEVFLVVDLIKISFQKNFVTLFLRG